MSDDSFSVAPKVTRRTAIGAAAMLPLMRRRGRPEGLDVAIATFSEDVTPPIGHPCMGGGIPPVREIADPLGARGIVLTGAGKPIVVVSVDWCEIRNDAYDRWRNVLAAAAETEPVRVLVSSVHQHDAPIADLEAERILEREGRAGRICDLDFHEKTVQRVADTMRKSLAKSRRVTAIGTGKARVEQVASNRRTVDESGKPDFGRGSSCRVQALRDRPEETIDPWLRTLSFWDHDQPLAALSFYATHPMSYYGQGAVSSDFVGLARSRRQAELPNVPQIYLSGCGGNVTAGKFNDGSEANRPILASRIQSAMQAAWDATERTPLTTLSFRSVPITLSPRSTTKFTPDELAKRLKTDPKPFGQCLAAFGLSWRKRLDRGQPIDLPVLDFGNAVLMLLPGESYVEFQLLAQRQRPNAFVVVAGYGECATGYVPIERAFEENDVNLNEWCWVDPGSEARMSEAIALALKPQA